MNIKKLMKNKKGFTLIEIIVVIVILAVLMAVAVPSVLNYIHEADNAKVMANGRAVMNSAQAEVVKEAVTSDGIKDSVELNAVKDKIIANCGVDVVVVVNKLYNSVSKVDEKTGDVTGTELLDKEAADTKKEDYNPELAAVDCTIDGKHVVAVVNDKVYVIAD